MRLPTARDSTELKEFLITLVGDAPFGILVADLDGHCTMANQRASRLFQREPDEVIDRSLLDLTSDVPQLRSRIEISLREGRFAYEIEEMPLGDEYYSVRAQPLLDGQLLVFDDVTRRVHSRQAQNRLTQDLAAANRNLEEFAYISAHDMKSPIASLAGLLQQLAEEDAVKEEARDLFEMAQRSVASMQRTLRALNEVLAFKKSSVASDQNSSLLSAYEQARGVLAPLIKASGTELSHDIDSSHTARMAPAHLQSLCSNLLSNAIKYASPERSPVVAVASEQYGDYLKISVEDNGIGMDLSIYGEKLFGLFNRFNKRVEGAGVGLYLVKSILDAYGGRVHVESSPGLGSRFTLEVPHG